MILIPHRVRLHTAVNRWCTVDGTFSVVGMYVVREESKESRIVCTDITGHTSDADPTRGKHYLQYS